MMHHALISLILCLPLFIACTPHNPHYNPSKAHHTPTGFKNTYPEPERAEGSFWAWRYNAWKEGLPKPPAHPITGVTPDLAYIQNNKTETAVSWVGHATLLYQIDGVNILTDPVFSDRASPLSFIGPKRHQPPGIALKDLPHIDVVVISHNHYEHLDLASVRALQVQAGGPPRFLVPLGIEAWFQGNVPGVKLEGADQNVYWLDWGDNYAVNGRTAPINFDFLSVQHWSKRTFWDRNATLWGSWAITHPSYRFWFSGDLGYSQATQDIGRTHGPFDLAAIAIGAYEPRWFMKRGHVNPTEAIQVMQDVGAKRAIGIHWGTFELTDESLDLPPQDLQKGLQAAGIAPERFQVMRHGETWRGLTP
ncbi:MAG: MBL fold metallo-hydrolase [Pseudomonadota bacterium]